MRADIARRALAALAAAASIAAAPMTTAAPNAPPLPQAVAALAPSLALQGGGEMTFLGFAIYDGWYWSAARGFSLEHPLALDLHYKRSFGGAAIAVRSVEEIERIDVGTLAKRARWGQMMRGIFPDVAKGDRLTGISIPPGTVRFFHNGVAIGEIDDREFARGFFGIWLDPKTSHPDFRQRLLGERR